MKVISCSNLACYTIQVNLRQVCLLCRKIESGSSTYGDDDLLCENPNRKQFDHFEENENTSSEDEEYGRSDRHYENEDNLVAGSEKDL